MARLLEGQRAIVTGASSGIGEAIARALAGAGAWVGINHTSRSTEAARRIESGIRANGDRALLLPGDVSHEPDVEAMFDRFCSEAGGIDILVANAGVQRDGAFHELSLDAWNEVIAVNLTGQFLCAREAVRRFIAQGPTSKSAALGKIVCVSSVHEVIPWAGHANYAASKGGVALMMRSLAQEVAPRRIRVNSIAPGAIRTRINREAWDKPEAEARLLELIPYGRVGEPADVAKAAVWLASDEADYVTGTTLFVDGGMTLYPGFADNG